MSRAHPSRGDPGFPRGGGGGGVAVPDEAAAHGGHWLPQELQARREMLRRGQSHLQQQIERLTDAYLAGVLGLEEFRRRRRDLDQAKEALEAQVRQLEAQVDRQTEIARLSLS